MTTRRFVPLALMAIALLMVSCSGSTAPTATATPTPPAPTNTPLPDVTVTPTPTPPPSSTEVTPPAPANTPTPAAVGTAEVTIVNFAFDPPSITVKVGTTVRWTNQDSAGHSVTSDTGVWDSGNIAQGQTYSRVFDTVGTFAYHCGIHPSMKGTITVTA